MRNVLRNVNLTVSAHLCCHCCLSIYRHYLLRVGARRRGFNMLCMRHPNKLQQNYLTWKVKSGKS